MNIYGNSSPLPDLSSTVCQSSLPEAALLNVACVSIALPAKPTVRLSNVDTVETPAVIAIA